MTKEQIKFLLDAGFTIDEIMHQTQPEPKPANNDDNPDQPKESSDAPDEEKDEAPDGKPVDPVGTGSGTESGSAIDAITRTIESLQSEIQKLNGRIAAQGVNGTQHEQKPAESIDSVLANLAQKFNGGK